MTSEFHSGQDVLDIIPAVGESVKILTSLRNQHLETVRKLENSKFSDNRDCEGLLMRITEVKESLQRLDLGLVEGELVMALSDCEEKLEHDQVQGELELLKIKDENDWLREELEETEKKLEDVLSRIAILEVDKQHHNFIQEVK